MNTLLVNYLYGSAYKMQLCYITVLKYLQFFVKRNELLRSHYKAVAPGLGTAKRLLILTPETLFLTLCYAYDKYNDSILL